MEHLTLTGDHRVLTATRRLIHAWHLTLSRKCVRLILKTTIFFHLPFPVLFARRRTSCPGTSKSLLHLRRVLVLRHSKTARC